MTFTGKFILWWLALSSIGLYATHKPGEPSARKYLNLGASYHEAGRTEEALLAYQDALDIRPHLPAALSNMAAIYMEQGKMFLAESLLQESIQYYPEFTSAYVNLAVIAIRSKQWNWALEILDKALTIKDTDWTIHLNRGEVLEVMGRPCESRAAYDRARAIRGDLELTRQRALRGYQLCPTG